jgi:hypothetical protein
VVAFENGTVVVRAGRIALRLRGRKGAAPDWTGTTGRLHMSGPPGDHGKSVLSPPRLKLVIAWNNCR